MNVLLKSGKLLDENGLLISSGFAFELVREYRKSDVVLQTRLKEINRYNIISKDFALSITVSSSANSSYVSLCFNDFNNNKSYVKTKIKILGYGNIVMPPDSRIGSIEYVKKDFSIEVYNNFRERKISFALKDLIKGKDFYCYANLKETTNGTSVVAIPFEKSDEFIYNQKITCLAVDGYVNIGDDKYEFNKDTRANIDWIRGVFPQKEIKYNYACLSSVQDGKEIGFTLVDKLGNNKYATSNMFFYDTQAYKLNEVKITPTARLRKNNKDWEIKSIDSQVDLIFSPSEHIVENIKNMFEYSNRNIIYGTYSGYLMFDKEKIEIKNLFGFIEVNNLKY